MRRATVHLSEVHHRDAIAQLGGDPQSWVTNNIAGPEDIEMLRAVNWLAIASSH